MKSNLTIVVLGGLGALVLIFVMMFGLQQVTPGSGEARVKLAAVLAKQFPYERVGIDPFAPESELSIFCEARYDPEAFEPWEDVDSRRAFDEGVAAWNAGQAETAEQWFQFLRERHRATAAHADYELWQVATAAWKAYQGEDRQQIRRVKVLRFALKKDGSRGSRREYSLDTTLRTRPRR